MLIRALVAAIWALAYGLLLTLAPAFGQQAVPPLSAHVIDTTHTLSLSQIESLENKLVRFEASRGSQIVVLIVPTTQPEDISSYANRVANTWKIGRKEIGDGLLVIVALNDRKVRIEVAKALEGAIPDLAAKGIIDQAISPSFKQGDYAGGLDAGLNLITARISGEALPAPIANATQASRTFDWNNLAVLVFFAVPFVAYLARSLLGQKLGTFATGAAIGGLTLFLTSSVSIAIFAAFAALIFTLFSPMAHFPFGNRRQPGGGWGAGSGGLGGGSFGSGGGGNFGGGGASGDW
jgi:uncharacterized protein